MKKKILKSHPKINTSALPDIIFMLLFFFMVVAVMRQKLGIRVQIPEATELQKIGHRALTHHIYIGPPINPDRGTAAVIQIEDAFIQKENVGSAVRFLVEGVPSHLRSLISTSLKVDESVKMGVVGDVKNELRKAKQLKVNYIVTPPGKE